MLGTVRTRSFFKAVAHSFATLVGDERGSYVLNSNSRTVAADPELPFSSKHQSSNRMAYLREPVCSAEVELLLGGLVAVPGGE